MSPKRATKETLKRAAGGTLRGTRAARGVLRETQGQEVHKRDAGATREALKGTYRPQRQSGATRWVLRGTQGSHEGP